MDWIKVEDRLPPQDGTLVDVWGSERERYANERIPDCWLYNDEWVHTPTIYDAVNSDFPPVKVYNVTHWMPLPQPPGE